MRRLARAGLIPLALALPATVGGCLQSNSYGVEERLALPAARAQVWAVAPATNLSGEAGIDPLLQADLLFAQLQTVRGIRAVPVNRVAEAYAGLRISGIASAEDAQAVCLAVGADALIVPSITLYDPYDPPRVGASIQVFAADGTRLQGGELPGAVAARQAMRTATDDAVTARWQMDRPIAASGDFLQQAGVFDASHGSVRGAALRWSAGRSDIDGPAGGREVFLVADRYTSFVYHALLGRLMDELAQRRTAATALAE